MSGKAAPTAGPIWVMLVPFTFMSTWTRGSLFRGGLRMRPTVITTR